MPIYSCRQGVLLKDGERIDALREIALLLARIEELEEDYQQQIGIAETWKILLDNARRNELAKKNAPPH